MGQSVDPQINIHENLKKTSRALAARIATVVRKKFARDETFSLALSGGTTPETLYSILAREYSGSIPWDIVHVFWSDERYLPPEDEHSNFRMARRALLDRVPIPRANIHPVPTETMDPMSSSHAYEDELGSHFDSVPPRFDLILLGMGADGHTASLFPHSEVLRESQRLVVPVQADAEPKRRLTFTFGLINNASRVYFLVAGEQKAEAVKKVLENNADVEEYPAAGVDPEKGELVWWLDADAASLLEEQEAG